MSFWGTTKKVEIDEVAKLGELREALTTEENEMVSDDDCHRFLRARNHDIHKTSDMVKKWAVWYHTPLPKTTDEEMTPANILIKQAEDKKEQVYIDMLPHSNVGEDKEGHPVYWEKTGLSKFIVFYWCYISKLLLCLVSSRFHEIKKHLSEDELFVRHVRQQELMINRCKMNSLKHNKKIEKQIIIFDLKDLSYTIDFMAMNTFRRTLQIDEASYPERLQTLYMINTPIFFTTIWSVVRRWIHPVTAAKIQMIGSKYEDKLKEFMHEDQIPVEYGGTKENFPWCWPANHENGKV